MSDEMTSASPVELATELTVAWLGNPNTRASSEEIPAFLNKLGTPINPGVMTTNMIQYS